MITAQVTLRGIFDQFANCPDPAYFHIAGDLSFADLYQRAVSLSEQLAGQDQNASPVIVWGHKNASYHIAYWACLLSGRTVVPVETDTPELRLIRIAQSSKARLLLSTEPDATLPVIQGVGGWSMHDLPSHTGEVTPLRKTPRSDADIAYIMFSSGSTGQPKGIKVTYANLANFVHWLQDDLLKDIPFNAVSGTVRHCFDVSLFELWSAWIRRKPISALDHSEFINSRKYIQRYADHGVGLWVSTPSTTQIYLKDKTFDASALPQLKTFLFCGEVLNKPLVETLRKRFPDARIINTYGPTECTVAVTSVTIEQHHLDAPDPLPIGQARPGCELSVQDGQIAIHGPCVGAGYLDMPEKQAAAFPAPQLYLSGDAGRQMQDGLWYFAGRIDREIKLLGMRMDLLEIETVIAGFDDIESAFVEPMEIKGTIRALNAYVHGPNTIDDLPAIARKVAEVLPPAMVPKFWYLCPDLHLNQNSKIDKAGTIKLASQAGPFVYSANAAPVLPLPPRYDVTEIALDRLGFLKCAEAAVKHHGPLVTLALPRNGRALTLLADTSHIQFWRENEHLFTKDHTVDGSGAAAMRSVLGKTLQTSCVAESWAEMRKEMVSLLSSSKEWFQRPLADATTQLVHDLSGPDALPLDELCLDWATKAICDPLFRNAALNAPAHDLLKTLDTNLFQRMAAIEPDHPDTVLDAHIDQLLQQIADGAATQSITDTILQSDQFPGTRDERMRRVVAGLLAASLHMNAMTLFWALVHLSEQPDLQHRIAAEAEPFGLDPRRMAQTPLAFATLRETLRMKPVTAFLERQIAAPFELDGFRFEAGQSVLFSPLLVHLNPVNWDTPTQFDPERFLNAKPASRDAYLPFGAGSRICPGSNIVNQQLTYALSVICQKLTLQRDPSTRPGDLKQMFRIVLEPRGAVKLNGARRLENIERA
ncbi:MAG: cytochrome P450 [Sulfitobacter sp.]